MNAWKNTFHPSSPSTWTMLWYQSVTHPSHIYLISPVCRGKHEMKSYYDLTRSPSFSYGSGANNWNLMTKNDILQGLQDTWGPKDHPKWPNLEMGIFFTDLDSQSHAWQGLGVVKGLQLYPQHCLHVDVTQLTQFRGCGLDIWATILGQPLEHYL